MECVVLLIAAGSLAVAVVAWNRAAVLAAAFKLETAANSRRFAQLDGLRAELAALQRTQHGTDASPSAVEPAQPAAKVAPAPPAPPPLPQPEPAPAVPPPSIAAPAPKPTPRPAFDWEGLVGVRLFSWIAGIALALAALFFLRYSIEHGWLGPAVRVALGAATGVGLLILCELEVARRYAVTAHALDAAGIAILFATFYAAHALWGLIGAPPAFAALALIAALAVALSLRRDSLFIALLGLMGGFATPILLTPATDRPVALFGYLLMLNAGLAWVALERGWPALSAASLVLTVAYQWRWTVLALSADNLVLGMAIFLAFPLLWLVAPRLAGRSAAEASPFARLASAGACVPLVFAVYLATSSAYGERFWLIFGFLLLLAVGLAAVAAIRGPSWLHAAAAGSVLIAFLSWTAGPSRAAAWPWTLAVLAAFVLFYLAARTLASKLGWPLGEAGPIAAWAAPLLFFVFPILAPAEGAGEPWLWAGVAFGLALAVAAFGLQRGDAWQLLLAAGLALVAEAVWAAEQLSVATVHGALLRQVVWGLFVLAVPLWAERRGRPLTPDGAMVAASGFCLVQPTLLMAAAAAPDLRLYAGAQLLLLTAFLATVERLGRGVLALLSVATSVLAVSVWRLGATDWSSAVVLSALFLAIHIAYPLVLGERARHRPAPVLTAVLASFGLFLPALASWREGDLDRFRGLVPLAFAVALAPLLARQLRWRSEESATPRQLTLLASAILAFVSIAIPLQLEREWITLGWALLAAALAWLSTRVEEPALRFWIFGLGTAAFVRLALNPAVLSYHPGSGTPIWNWYTYTYLVPVLAFLAAARWLEGGGTTNQLAPGLRLSPLLKSAAGILLFLLLNVEIADFYSTGETLSFGFLTDRASLAEDLTYTLGWAVFALAFLAVGIASQSKPTRLAAILLLSAAVLKGFLRDMAQLGGLYRVASFVGLALSLAAVAVLLQRFVLRQREPPTG